MFKQIKNQFLLFSLVLFFTSAISLAQGPQGKDFGFGLVLGDPTGGTVKYWTNHENAFNFTIGGSYFGNPRIGADYLWHFQAFDSDVVEMYAGPGLALGFGHGDGIFYKRKGDKFYIREDNEAGIGVRAIVGLNIIPRRTPIEIFVEFGPLIGISPGFGSAVDAALGIRFYP